jgi:Resolvase, N terminal domain
MHLVCIHTLSGSDPKELKLAGHQPTATLANPVHSIPSRVLSPEKIASVELIGHARAAPFLDRRHHIAALTALLRLGELGRGDVLIVTRLDRLARSTRHLLNILTAVIEKDAAFKSLSEDWANTTTAVARSRETASS